LADWNWIDRGFAFAVHDHQLELHGGGRGVRNEGLLDSALARPQNLDAYGSPDAAALAASYAFGIARNHPFVDGNKRVAHAAMETFLVLNGQEIEASIDDQEELMLDLARGVLSRERLTAWLAKHVRPRS
jgi:death-on-curing protein